MCEGVRQRMALMWVGLLANIGFMLSLVMLLQGLLPQPTHKHFLL